MMGHYTRFIKLAIKQKKNFLEIISFRTLCQDIIRDSYPIIKPPMGM